MPKAYVFTRPGGSGPGAPVAVDRPRPGAGRTPVGGPAAEVTPAGRGPRPGPPGPGAGALCGSRPGGGRSVLSADSGGVPAEVAA